MMQWLDTKQTQGWATPVPNSALPDAKSREFRTAGGRTVQPQSRQLARTFLLELCLAGRSEGIQQDVLSWQLYHGGPDNQLTHLCSKVVWRGPTPLQLRSGTLSIKQGSSIP